MHVVRESVELPVPAAEVFAFVAEPANYPRYVAAWRGGDPLQGEAGRVGASFRWRTRWPGLAAEETIVERCEGERIRFRGRMAGTPFESCIETRSCTAGTRLTITIEYSLSRTASPLGGWVRRRVERDVLAALERLQSVFAGGGPAELRRTGAVYRAWGRHPALYAAQDAVTFAGRPRQVRRRAVAALGPVRGACVLEVACGTGRDFPALREAIGPEGTLVGFDYSLSMLEAARALVRRRGWRNVELLQGDAALLDVGARRFDGVLCVLGMSAIPRHVQALERCREVLRPGARASVCDARPVQGRPGAIAALLRAVYGRLAAWDADRDVAGDFGRVFEGASVEDVNFGTLFIAAATKR